MLDDLHFVKGAVGKRELVKGMTHFQIENGRIYSYNGNISLSSPIALDFNCSPKADLMIKAIENCREATQMVLTGGGKLSIKSGGFSANVICLDEPVPHVNPAGPIVQLDAEAFITAFRVLFPFIGTNNLYPFATGVRLKGSCVTATNNVIFVEYWTGVAFPHEVVIPRAAVQELLRIKEIPTHIQYDNNHMTFLYPSGRWLNTTLLDAAWPATDPMFNREHHPEEIDHTLFSALDTIEPFADEIGSVFIENGTVRTHFDIGEGASNVISNQKIYGRYQIQMLKMLKGVAQKIDMTCYDAKKPSHSIFYGDRLRGIISGMRL